MCDYDNANRLRADKEEIQVHTRIMYLSRYDPVGVMSPHKILGSIKAVFDFYLTSTSRIFRSDKQRSQVLTTKYLLCDTGYCRSQWPCGLRRRSSAARLLRSWVRIPPGAWMFVCCECCVLSGRGLCDVLIIRSEDSYRLWRVVVCDQETS